jgi:nitrate reductase cytochrome c-type subunit
MLRVIGLLLLISFIHAKYLDSKSCKECHDVIYDEHISSMHAKSSLFKDQFHKKMKEINFPNKYKCAVCHIPGADDLDKIVKGEIQPKPTLKQEDGVSCMYCHSITAIKKSHTQNSNRTTYRRDEKPMM